MNTTRKKGEEMLTLTEAAELIGLDSSGLRRAILAGKLPATKFGKTWIVSREDVERWNAEQRKPVGRPATKK
jgi:excisionase family DNA binding protein